MKYIQKKKRRISIKLILFFISVILVGALAIFLNNRLKPSSNKELSDLILSDKLNPPECSMPGGFYTEPFTIIFNPVAAGTRIIYTLDGSEPSLAANVYSEPVLIDSKQHERNRLSAIPTSPRWKPPIGDVFKGTVLRAVVVDENNFKSPELVRTFFVDKKGKSRYSLPVITITINEDDFFGYKNGIYVLGKSYSNKSNYAKKDISLNLPWWEYPSNYLLRGADAERPACIEFYEPNGKLGFQSGAGIRINGNATRGYAQKSLRISFRKKYGPEYLIYPLFSPEVEKTFNSFILRNSGNDWDKTMFRDAFMQSLMKNSNLDIQEYRPSVVFINGEYWGIHNIRERFDENYLVNKYHLPVDSISILEFSGTVVYGKKGADKSFKELLQFVKENDISLEKNYNYIKSQIDIKSFSDFLIANIFFCNSDWPNNNVKFWQYTGKKTDSISLRNSRWHWMLYDTDWGFGYNVASTPENNLLGKAKSTGSVGILFNSLIRNKEFVNEFVRRFQYHLDTTFYTPSMLAKINEMAAVLAPEIQEHIDRWTVIGSYEKWLANVEVMKDFATRRPEIQAQQLNDFFSLRGSQRLVVKR